MSDHSYTPLVTLGMPTYNRAASSFLQALDSALAQTYANLEIVISDNASTDGTEALVRSRPDPRVRYFRQERNIPAVDNFNYCLEQARGKYFLLLFDDDLIDPDFVTCCIAATGGDANVALIRTGIRMISGSGQVTREQPNCTSAESLAEFVPAWFRYETQPYCCNTLLNTRTLREVGGFRSRKRLFADVLAHVRVAATGRSVNVADVKASFRRHEANTGSAAKIEDWCDDSLELLDAICELLPAQARELRPAGEKFFAGLNYGSARRIGSLWARFKAYRAVGAAFPEAEAPWKFAWHKDTRPRLRSAKASILRRFRSGAG
jgi:glycosyltransferase involved in cell wall biosynthesis